MKAVEVTPACQARRSGLLLLLLVSLLALSQSAYLILTGDQREPVLWGEASLPVRMQVWRGFTDQLPSIVAGSRPKIAFEAALNEWVGVSSIAVSLSETSRSLVGQDGVNLITISDDPTHRDLIGENLAVALMWTLSSRIIEADVAFNPSPPSPWSTIEDKDDLSLLDVAVHEFGHTLGMEHSVARSSRMFFQAGAFNFGLHGLSYDDLAGINLLYPLPGLDRLTGSIAGTVTRDGQPVFGAFVVAADQTGALAANAITQRNGSYRIDRLPPGLYSLYAEPLDGPTTPLNLAGTLVSPATDLVTDFLPAFHGGSMAPTVELSAGALRSGVDIAVSRGNVSVDPEFVGVVEKLGSGIRATSTPASAFQGSSPHFVAAGKGVEQLPEQQAFVLLGAISTDGNVAQTLSNGSIVFKLFPMTIADDVPRGDYSAFFRRGAQFGVVTGGLQVFSPFRFLQAFGQFAHMPGIAGSSAILVNLHPELSAQGRVTSQGSTPGALDLEGLPPAGAGGAMEFDLLPAGALLARSRGPQEFRGAMLAESTRSLGAAVLVESPFGTTGLNPSPPLQYFVAPVEVASGGQGADTGLALANLDERGALVYLQLQDSAGRVLGEAVQELAPRAHLSRFVREMIPGAVPPDFKGSVAVTSNRALIATVIRTSPGVFTTLPVIQNRVAPQRVFPQFVQFGPLSSELILVNPSPTRPATGVEVQVRGQNGLPAPVTLNGTFHPNGRLTLNLPPLGSTRLLSSQTEVIGWVEVSSQPGVGGVLLYRSAEVGTAGIGAGAASTQQVLPVQRIASQALDMGIAIVNLEPGPVRVTLQANDAAGTPAGNRREVVLGPFQQLARFPNDGELNLGLPDDFLGSLWLDADGRIGVTGILQSPGVLTTLPTFNRQLPIIPADDL